MGMVSNLARVSEEQFESFSNDPRKFEDLIYDQTNFDAEWILDLDKGWDAVQYVLTGNGINNFKKPTTIGRAIFSGQILDEEQDLGYGPAHYITADQVKETNLELQKLSREEILSRIDSQDMNSKEIYPGYWDQEETEEFVVDSVLNLQEFYQDAALKSQVILTWLS